MQGTADKLIKLRGFPGESWRMVTARTEKFPFTHYLEAAVIVRAQLRAELDSGSFAGRYPLELHFL